MVEFLKHLLAPGTKAPRWFTALVVLALAGTAWWYVREAVAHGDRVSSRINHALDRERDALYGGDKLKMEQARRPVHAYDLNDQRVYMNYAKGIREQNWGMFITRMRMPMYMYALALATDGTPRKVDWYSLEAFYTDFFPVARAFNIGLSLILLVAMFFALRPWLGNWLGIAFTLVAAFQLYILKSPYVQPEVLQTTIITVCVAWIVRALDNPTWYNALIAGVLLCLWHMTKANALVAVALMGATMGAKVFLAATWPQRRRLIIAGLAIVALGVAIYSSVYLYGKHAQDGWHVWFKEIAEANGKVILGLAAAVFAAAIMCRGKQPRRLATFIAGPIVLIGYLLPMTPWMAASKKYFGDPFHNTQSKYYMWADDVHDKHRMQAIGLDRNLGEFDKDGDLRVDESQKDKLPGPAKYWREHTWDDIKNRISRGTTMMFVNCFEEYTAIHWLQMLWAGILLWTVARRWTDFLEAWDRWKWEIVYVVGLLTVLVLLFGWFTPLKVGPRLLNSISLVPLAFCMAGARWLLRNDVVRVRGAAISTEKLLALCFLATWFALTAYALPSDLENGYFAG
jgi:hypothetical protein